MPSEDLLSLHTFVKKEIGYINLAGRLVAETRFDFKSALRDLLALAPNRIIVSLGPLEYIDSAGVAALIGAWKQVKESGGELVLAEINPTLHALFEVSSIYKFFRIFPDIAAATEYFLSKTE